MVNVTIATKDTIHWRSWANVLERGQMAMNKIVSANRMAPPTSSYKVPDRFSVVFFLFSLFSVGEMMCGFGDIAVRAKWINANRAECIVPPLNCTYQDGQCALAKRIDAQNPTPPTPAGSPGPSNPDYAVAVQFNFSLDNGQNWFPLNESMKTFVYKPCRPVCNYVTGTLRGTRLHEEHTKSLHAIDPVLFSFVLSC